MRINVWKTSSAAAVRAALRRSTRSTSAAAAQNPFWRHTALSQPRACGISLPIGRVQLLSTIASNDGPSIWQIAEQLRDVDRNARADREPVVAAIQSVVIKPGSTDDRERQALDIIQSNVLESLLGFLADERLVDFHVPTFLSLIKLTSEAFIAQEILRLDTGISTIAKYLTHPDPRLQAAASLTIGNLALDPSAAAPLSSSAVVEGLFHVLSSPHEAIQRTAATSIANIAGSTLGRQQLCHIDHVVALCNLLSGEYSDSLRSAVAFALGNILSDHDVAAQDALRESGALPELILLVSPAYPDEICSTAAWAIHHGVHLNHESQSMVAEAGGLGMLFQHVFADNETLQTNALLALESTITGHEANVQSCRDNTGAVELLEALKGDPDDELNPNAKRALDAMLQQIL